MSVRIGTRHTGTFAALLMFAGAFAPAGAQTSYPSFQQSRVVPREFNFAVADGAGATAFVFQWRNATSVGSQLSLDVGVSDSDGDQGDAALILGGQFAQSLARASADMPLDLLLTAGLFSQFGDNVTFIAVPVGVSLGHRFPIQGTAMAITPYAHPRIALQYVKVETPLGDASDTEMEIAFDIGGNLELTPRLALRLSATFGDFDALGLSLAYSPRGLRTTSVDPSTPRR